MKEKSAQSRSPRVSVWNFLDSVGNRGWVDTEWRNKYPSDGPGVKKMDQLGVADKIERRRRVRLIYSPIHSFEADASRLPDLSTATRLSIFFPPPLSIPFFSSSSLLLLLLLLSSSSFSPSPRKLRGSLPVFVPLERVQSMIIYRDEFYSYHAKPRRHR